MSTNDKNISKENENMEGYSEEMFESENVSTDDVDIEDDKPSTEQSQNEQTEPEEKQSADDFDIEDEKPSTEQTQNEQTEPEEKLTKLPLARIKNIMKMDPDLNLTSQEAVFLVAKATEYSLTSNKNRIESGNESSFKKYLRHPTIYTHGKLDGSFELFIGSLARETFAITFKNKKKTMQRKDLDAAIESVDALCFLEGTLD